MPKMIALFLDACFWQHTCRDQSLLSSEFTSMLPHTKNSHIVSEGQSSVAYEIGDWSPLSSKFTSRTVAPFLNAHFWWHMRMGIKGFHPLNLHQCHFTWKIVMLPLNALQSPVCSLDHLQTRTWPFWTELIVQFRVLQIPWRTRPDQTLPSLWWLWPVPTKHW